MNVNEWIVHLRHPLVLVGFALFIFALVIKPLFPNSKKLSGPLIAPLLRWGMILLFLLAAMAMIGGFALSWKATPAVSSGIGLSREQFAAMLNEQQERVIQEIRAAGGDEQKLRLLEAQLQAVEAKRADFQKSYEEELARRKAADKALAELKGQLPAAQLEKAQINLQQGNTKEAETALDAIVDKGGETIAFAAWLSGLLAEGRLDYVKAMRQYKKAVMLEEENPDYLLAAGAIAHILGDDDRAQEWLKRLLIIREAEGKNDVNLADAQEMLASIYADTCKCADSELLFHLSLDIREKKLGRSHYSVARILNKMAKIYRDQKRNKEAIYLYEKALSIAESPLFGDYITAAAILNNISVFNADQGNYTEAEPMYKRALAIWEKLLGKKHPNVAIVLSNLAWLRVAQERYQEAEPLFKRALDIWEQKLGKNHPDVAATLNNLALLYYVQGRHAEAEPLFKRALDIWEQKFGKDHTNVAIVLGNLAELYRVHGKYTEAEPLYKRSLEIDEKMLGKEHQNVATHMNNLAVLYWQQGVYEKAEPLFRRSLDIWERKLGKEDSYVANSVLWFTVLYEAQGKYAEAEPLYQRVLAIFKAKLPAGHPNIKTAQANYDALKKKLAGM